MKRSEIGADIWPIQPYTERCAISIKYELFVSSQSNGWGLPTRIYVATDRVHGSPHYPEPLRLHWIRNMDNVPSNRAVTLNCCADTSTNSRALLATIFIRANSSARRHEKKTSTNTNRISRWQRIACYIAFDDIIGPFSTSSTALLGDESLVILRGMWWWCDFKLSRASNLGDKLWMKNSLWSLPRQLL